MVEAALPRRRARPALPRPRAAARSGHHEPARPRPHRAVRHRRGALRVPVGPRLPARLPGAVRCCTSAGPTCPRIALTATATRATHAEIATPAQAAATARALRRQLRPAQHPVPDRAQERAAPPAPRACCATEHAGDAGIVYCLSRNVGRARPPSSWSRTGIPALPYHAGLDAADPRRATRRASCARTAWSWSRRSPSAWASTSPTSASSPTSTCPSRSRATTRRPAGPGRDGLPSTAWLAYGLADVVQQRKMIDDVRRRPGPPAQARAAPRRDAGAVRDGRVPPGAAARLLRPGRRRPCGNCDTCLAPPESWDGTVAAQKLLSTVFRLDRERHQRFGAGQIIDILLGKRTPKVEQFGHDALSVFGVGTELSEGEWRGVVRQLLAAGAAGGRGQLPAPSQLTEASADRCCAASARCCSGATR